MDTKLKKIIIMLALSPACFLMGGQPVTSVPPIATAPVQAPSDSVSFSITTTTMPIANTFVEPQRFASTEKFAVWNYKGHPIAGVVNHHSLAMDLIAGFFKILKAVKPGIKTFFILSPDHFTVGQDISISRLPYATPAGLTKIDNRMLDTIVELGVYDGSDKRTFEKEHGIGVLAPFIKREFPDAEVVPIFLSHNALHERLEVLGRLLATLADDATFVVISSDMSHYQRREDATARDRETMEWLARGEWSRLETATDKNSDSSASFIVLHEYLSALRIKYNFRTMLHASSYDYTHDPSNVTTYIVGFWE